MQALYTATAVHCTGRYLLREGAAPGRVLRGLNLPPSVLLDSNLWLERDTVVDIGEALIRESGDPLAVVRAVEFLELQDFGDWSGALVADATLLDALRYLCLTISRLETGTRVSLHLDGQRARLRSTFVGNFPGDPTPLMEANLFMLRKVLLLAVQPFAIRTRLAHPAHDSAALQDIYHADVEFNCPDNELLFPRDALGLALDEQGLRLAESRACSEMTCREVSRIIQSMLSYERPTATGVADQMSLNLRSLQRHLAAWGISFEEILDTYRQRSAMAYLADDCHTMAEIAQLLGYSDGAHFTRACKRWYGVPPTRLKDQIQRKPGRRIRAPILAPVR